VPVDDTELSKERAILIPRWFARVDFLADGDHEPQSIRLFYNQNGTDRRSRPGR
jgi:hypothetical protein